MMALTDEQTSVIDDFVIHDRNVVLRANYGSGKTTVLQIVNDVHASGGCALCLVYNASMKYEMRAKAELHSKHTIHTIHSAAQFIFEGVCGSNDDGIETSICTSIHRWT
jgi:predicted ATP-binding protein involved in virulence